MTSPGGVPQAMHRFQAMISEDMVPSVSVAYRKIETASTEIKRRADMVNTGLQQVEFNEGTHLQITWTPHQFESVRQFRRAVDDLLKHAPDARAVPEQALRQFTRVRDLMARFTGSTPEDKRWRDTVLDVRLAFSFYGRELDADGNTVHTYRNTAAGSGGEQEKLVAFCLAAALSYNLADDRSGGRPRFAPLMLDEAFSKSDEHFAGQALAAFDQFGFQLLMAAPIRMSGIVEPFIGQAVLVEKRRTADGAHSNAASATFGELAARRDADADGAYVASGKTSTPGHGPSPSGTCSVPLLCPSGVATLDIPRASHSAASAELAGADRSEGIAALLWVRAVGGDCALAARSVDIGSACSLVFARRAWEQPMTVSEDFTGVVGRLRGELLAHCYRMVGSAEEAEDLVQE